MLMELQYTIGKMLLLFLNGRLVVSGRLPLSSSTPWLNNPPSVYGENISEDTLGRGQVHFWGAGCFGIEAAKRWGIREGGVKA